MGYETFPKSGKTTHKDFGTEKGGDFVPNHTKSEYDQIGSSRTYPKGALAGGKDSFDGKLVSASYPRSLKQNGFNTKSNKQGLDAARTKTQKEA
jgi:hypothetical protein